MYIVGFNGPPRSGKDTLAEMLAQHMDSAGVTIPVFTLPLSLPLREIAFTMAGLKYSQVHYEDFKTTHFPMFGKTGRQLMIDVSESFLKPVYGQDIMAKLLYDRIPLDLAMSSVLLVPDCGFQVETEYLGNTVGAENFFLARVRRTGCDFSNDSRGWVNHRFDVDIPNGGTLEELRDEAAFLYRRLVNYMGWKF